jgi:hypothetical protein
LTLGSSSDSWEGECGLIIIIFALNRGGEKWHVGLSVDFGHTARYYSYSWGVASLFLLFVGLHRHLDRVCPSFTHSPCAASLVYHHLYICALSQLDGTGGG